MSSPLTSGRYAAVTSTLALVIALGGTSYAAVQITGKQIKNNTVSTKDVKDQTLTTADLAPGTSLQGPAGPAGTQGPTGPIGPSNAYSVSNDNTTALVGTVKQVLSLDLPAGSYVANAKVTATRTSGTAVGEAVCQLEGGGGFDSAVAAIPAGGFGFQGLPVQLAFTLAAPGPLVLTCYDLAGGTTLGVYRKKLTAVRVGNLALTAGPDVARSGGARLP